MNLRERAIKIGWALATLSAACILCLLLRAEFVSYGQLVGIGFLLALAALVLGGVGKNHARVALIVCSIIEIGLWWFMAIGA